MFGETTIFYIKIWNHPIETTKNKWLFGVPGGSFNFRKGSETDSPQIAKGADPYQDWPQLQDAFALPTSGLLHTQGLLDGVPNGGILRHLPKQRTAGIS